MTGPVRCVPARPEFSLVGVVLSSTDIRRTSRCGTCTQDFEPGMETATNMPRLGCADKIFV